MRFAVFALSVTVLCGQETPSAEAEAKRAPAYQVQTGTRVPLVMINSISTKHAAEGDRIYLETSFPIAVDGRIVIPPGSHVAGTVTAAKRAGRVKGRSELYVRFDSLMLPNGVSRDFRARMGGLDGRSADDFDRNEGKIKGEATKGRDAVAVATAAGAGTSVGVIAGSAAGRPMMGTAIGAAAGAAAGIAGVLMTRGQDVVLGRGTVVEMVLDRPLEFTEQEIDFSGALTRRSEITNEGPAPKRPGSPGLPGRRPVLGIP
jgi:type IV secretion system protein VirB10